MSQHPFSEPVAGATDTANQRAISAQDVSVHLPPILPDEEKRLATLRRYAVLDTDADPELDIITELAADRFNTRIALVSLVDEHRQWFKSRVGLDATETPRSDSFCAHAIARDDALVVLDATQDPRFANNPLVVGPPHIRFYAGMPLVTGTGYRIGTLCVIDPEPRADFTARDEKALRLLSNQVMAFLDTLDLRQQQRMSQLIGNTTTDAFVCADPENRIIHWNRGAEKMFGWSVDEALGQSLHLIIPNRHQHDHEMAMVRMKAGMPTKLVGKTVEVPARRKSGDEIPVELSLGMWTNPVDGLPAGFTSIIRDVSERKRLEAERAVAERKLLQQMAAIEASTDGIALTDANGVFTFMNQEHATMFGYASADELVGKPWQVLYADQEIQYLSEHAMPLLQRDGRWRGDVRALDKDGNVVEQEVSLSLSVDGGIVCITRNISSRLATEREKARLREQLMLAQRQEAVGLLASGIAHDFNNLIAAIDGTAGLLARNSDPGVVKHAQRVQSAASSAAGLVQKFLSLGRRENNVQAVDLRNIVTNVRELVATSLTSFEHRIELSIPDAPLTVVADPTELMQILLNLTINARDALPQDKPASIALTLKPSEEAAQPVGPVVVGLIPEGQSAVVEVRDTGCGIALENLRQVFEAFYTSKGQAGTGLGLAVVAGLIEKANAAIAVTSAVGEGTTFQLWWPLQAQKPLTGDPEADADSGSKPASTRTVLVVDDNLAVLETVAEMLNESGYNAVPFSDPIAAVAAFADAPERFNLVLTDYDMPTMTGAGLARVVKATRPSVPVILLSALANAHKRRPDEPALFDAVLAKPVALPMLCETLENALAGADGAP